MHSGTQQVNEMHELCAITHVARERTVVIRLLSLSPSLLRVLSSAQNGTLKFIETTVDVTRAIY